LQSAIFNSANFSSIATDAKGVIQIFNVGAERMLGYTAAEVMNQIGFDVVEALQLRSDTAHIPILVVTAKQITGEDRARLNGYVAAIMETAEFDRDRFTAEVRRAMSGRHSVA
jgi:PAS domain-containing protein